MSGASFPTVDQALASARRSLIEAGISTAALDARLLLGWATGLSPELLVMRGRDLLDAAQVARLDKALAARAAGMPVSRFLGKREFWGLELGLSAETLDPRPDTETLVNAVLARLGHARAPFIRDLGTGTGAVLLALLSELPRARGLGSDLSFGAVQQARENARAVGVSARAGFILSDWGSVSARRADVLVSNPPYIARGELAGLDTGVKQHDPRRALDGGADGLEPYRMIADQLSALAHPGALVAFETGHRQAEAVLAILAGVGADTVRPECGVVCDLAGLPRAVVARAPLH